MDYIHTSSTLKELALALDAQKVAAYAGSATPVDYDNLIQESIESIRENTGISLDPDVPDDFDALVDYIKFKIGQDDN